MLHCHFYCLLVLARSLTTRAYSHKRMFSSSAFGDGDEGPWDMKLWSASTGQLKFTLEGHTAEVNIAVFSQDGRMLLTGADDCQLKLWCVKTGVLKQTLEGHEGFIEDCCWTPDSKAIVSSSGTSLKLWS